MAASGQGENRRSDEKDDEKGVDGVQGTPSSSVEPPPPAVDASSGGTDGDAERPSYAGRLLVAAALVVLALGALAIVATLSDPNRLGLAFSGTAGPAVPVAEPGGAGAAASAAESGTGGVLTAPLDGRERATFELADALTRLDLRVDDLGEDLYRITVPADGALVPRPEVRGEQVRLGLTAAGRPGPAAVEVVLNSRVTWRLRLAGGITEQRLDLGAARLAGVDLVGTATRTDLRLPRVTGTLVVRVRGGMNRLDILVPGEPPVRVRAAAGAGSISVRGGRTDGVAAGTLLDDSGWDRAVDRLYVDLVAGANIVTVTAG